MRGQRASLVEMTSHWREINETNRLNLAQVERKVSLALLVLIFLFSGCEQLNKLTVGPSSSSIDNELGGGGDVFELVSDHVLFADNTIANTGIGYDSLRNQMIFAAWDSKIDRNFLRITDMDLKHLCDIELNGKIRFLQGVTYEKERDLIWVWGTRPNAPFAEWTDCFGLYGFDAYGVLRDELTVPMAEWYPGMIAYAGNGRMWMKANTKTTARLYDMKLGMALVKEVETGIGGEGIASDEEGNIWVHGGCKVKMVNPNTEESREFTSPNEWCAEEGMTFDGQGHLWLGSDDGYHFNLEGGNHVWKMRV